jgi:hypothetical protein
LEKSSKSLADNGLPEVMDIPPLPMNNDDLSRLLKASGLILNENGDFALPSNKFSKEEISKLSHEEMELHRSNNLYRLIGLWECQWKDPTERATLRQELSKYYSLSAVEILHPALVAANRGTDSNEVIKMTVSENAPLVVPSISNNVASQMTESGASSSIIPSTSMDDSICEVDSKIQNIEYGSVESQQEMPIPDFPSPNNDDIAVTPNNVDINLNANPTLESLSLDTLSSITTESVQRSEDSQNEQPEPAMPTEPINTDSSVLLVDYSNPDKVTLPTVRKTTERPEAHVIDEFEKVVQTEENLLYESEEVSEAKNKHIKKASKSKSKKKEKGKSSEAKQMNADVTPGAPQLSHEENTINQDNVSTFGFHDVKYEPPAPAQFMDFEQVEKKKSDKKKSKKKSASSSEQVDHPTTHKVEQPEMSTSASTSPNVSERLARTSMPNDNRPEQSTKSSISKVSVESAPTTSTKDEIELLPSGTAAPKKGFGKLLKGFLKKK